MVLPINPQQIILFMKIGPFTGKSSDEMIADLRNLLKQKRFAAMRRWGNRSTNAQISTEAPLLQNRCYLHVALFISILLSILDKI